MSTLHVRSAVIDRGWRSLGPGLEPLSASDGSPLSRTVKLVLMPLVLRPTEHTEFAAPLLDDAAAHRLTALLEDHRSALRATAGWFVLLKRARRRARITGGDPQRLYFQRCFEMAVQDGEPGDHPSADDHAEAVARELDARPEGVPTLRDLRETLADEAVLADLDQLVREGWSRRLDGEPAERLSADHGTVLLVGLGDPAVRDQAQQALDRLVGDRQGSATGRVVWQSDGVLADCLDPRLGRVLGLTDHDVPMRPVVADSRRHPNRRRPLDRSVAERLEAILSRAAEPGELPPIGVLLRGEAGRSCCPWALRDESLRVAMGVGVRLAAGLDGVDSPWRADRLPLHDTVNARLRLEASIARARRGHLTPSPDAPGELAQVAQDINRPWSAYGRRLWVRLHGFDVRNHPLDEVDELRDVLEGVVRSIVLDHRSRVRDALTSLARRAPAPLANHLEATG